jgi:uncharacterized protein YjbI with pentapeptide repeats
VGEFMQNEDRIFKGQDLRGWSFKGQDLTGADFSDCDVRGVDFSFANLTNTKFCNARMGKTVKAQSLSITHKYVSCLKSIDYAYIHHS